MPSPGPPSVEPRAAGVASPPSHFCAKIATTRSPGLKRRTPGPTDTTSPAPSDSGISGSFWRGLY